MLFLGTVQIALRLIAKISVSLPRGRRHQLTLTIQDLGHNLRPTPDLNSVLTCVKRRWDHALGQCLEDCNVLEMHLTCALANDLTKTATVALEVVPTKPGQLKILRHPFKSVPVSMNVMPRLIEVTVESDTR